jgi:protein transport protein SEC31
MAVADRFNRLAWGAVDGRPKGVIAAGLENGELALWDPAKILAGAECVFLSVALNVAIVG